jgi:hypothetical protein
MTETVEKQLEEMSMAELWSEAKKLGVSKDGKKDELIARIREAQASGGATKLAETPKEAVYIAKYHELKLVMNPAYIKEVSGRVITVAGRSIQFHEGVYRTSDAEEIEFLDNHKNFGNVYRKVDRNDLKLGKPMEQVYKEKFQTLEDREKAIAAREEALKKKEMSLKGFEEGAPKQQTIDGVRSSADQPKF